MIKCEDFSSKYFFEKETDTTKRIELLNTFIEGNSKCIDALLTRADLFFLMGEIVNAKKDYLKVFEQDANNIYALYKLGVTYQIEDDLDSSLLYLNQALSRKRNGNIVIDYNVPSEKMSLPSDKYDVLSSEIVFQIGVVYYYLRQSDNADGSFDYCLRNKYKIGDSYFYKAAILYENQKIDSACAFFRLSLLHGNDSSINYIEKYCPDSASIKIRNLVQE